MKPATMQPRLMLRHAKEKEKKKKAKTKTKHKKRNTLDRDLFKIIHVPITPASINPT